MQEAGVTIASPNVALSPDSWFEGPCVVNAVMAPHNTIQVGAFTGAYGGRLGHCTIGRYCSIAPGVDIASDQHPVEWLSSSMIQYVPDLHGWGGWLKSKGYDAFEPQKSFDSNAVVCIGHDVWLGQGVFIKSGVSIGNGAVVAAHSVVVKDVPPYSIVAGVPAKIIRPRFDERTIERMQRVQWWRYSIAGIAGLDYTQPAQCLDRIEELAGLGLLLPFDAPRYRLVDSKLALIGSSAI